MVSRCGRIAGTVPPLASRTPTRLCSAAAVEPSAGREKSCRCRGNRGRIRGRVVGSAAVSALQSCSSICSFSGKPISNALRVIETRL